MRGCEVDWWVYQHIKLLIVRAVLIEPQLGWQAGSVHLHMLAITPPLHPASVTASNQRLPNEQGSVMETDEPFSL